eukprot:CAMPEP_0180134760 /NCGR_PEP_ID=MMETSP0986-20121125/10365_1 /TAXON_ID=697907 /ORGANISM="non described non described, Strain CCMP2293" /LENGTH=71 /DNA_ID=CAMNT_0022075205 /DNA_START=88 /DNA_END=303 /DNA_ORIENTATION=+
MGNQIFGLVPIGGQSGGQRLNQTYGWGTESGDSFGNGGGYDSGVGTNAGDAELYPYNARGPRAQGLRYVYR